MSKEQVIEILKSLEMARTGIDRLPIVGGMVTEYAKGYNKAVSEQNAKIQAVINKLEKEQK